MRPGEWERLRTGIALKTFTALMKRYQHMSAAEEAKKLREARRFAKVRLGWCWCCYVGGRAAVLLCTRAVALRMVFGMGFCVYIVPDSTQDARRRRPRSCGRRGASPRCGSVTVHRRAVA
jgi:hypothetical protein